MARGTTSLKSILWGFSLLTTRDSSPPRGTSRSSRFLDFDWAEFLTGTQLTDRFQLTTRSCSPRSFSTFSFYYRVCVSACRPLPLRRPATSPSAFLLLTNCVRKLKTTSLARLKILSRPSQGCFDGCQLLLKHL